MGGRLQYKPEQFLEAIKDSAGIITTIAKRVGCEWHTAKKYIDLYDDVRQAYDSECERVIDLAELKAIELINEKDAGMVKWYLSTKGKYRGYTEKREIEHSGGVTQEVTHTVDLSELSDDDIETINEILGRYQS